jgi:hypothetical protein
MEIRFTAHANQQLAFREIDRELAVQVARQPEQIIREPDIPPVAQSRFVEAGKTVLVRVAYRDEGDVRLIITVYKTSKIAKYWQE